MANVSAIDGKRSGSKNIDRTRNQECQLLFRFSTFLKVADCLGALVDVPWLQNTHNNDYDYDKEEKNNNAHPFSRVPL